MITNTNLALAVLSTALAASTLFLLYERRVVQQQNASTTKNNRSPKRTTNDEEGKELLKEQLSRTQQFLGEDGMRRLRAARVTVIGLGGVGSHAAHLLARSGLGKLRLVDFDRVTLSSLNRHALATRSDVGLEKTEALASHLYDILGHGNVEIECVSTLCSLSNVHEIIKDSDIVLDCIDDQTTKLDLLEACQVRGIPLLSSLGAGGKVDPTRLRIGRMSDSSFDPLAARLRARIVYEKRNINMELIEVVYSSEEPRATLLDLNEEQRETPQDFGAMPHFRLRIMPVLGTSPALFGITLAARAITRVAHSMEFTPVPVDQVSRNNIHSYVQRVRNNEVRVFKRGPDRFAEEEAIYVAIMARKRCMFTGAKMGTADGKMELGRWDSSKPLDVDNCILAVRRIVDRLYAFHASNTGRTRPNGEDLGVEQSLVDVVERWLNTDKTKEYGI